MAKNWSRRHRAGVAEPKSSKRQREARERERRKREAEGLIRLPEVPRTIGQWILAGKKRLAPCGKAALDEETARERAVENSRGGNRFSAYECPFQACRLFGYWHLRDDVKAQRKRNERKRETGARKRQKLRAEVPLRTWEDDGGGCQATWLAHGLTVKMDRLD